MKKPLKKALFLLAALSLLAGCSSSNKNGKKQCDEDGVCRIGYKIQIDR